MNSSITVHTVQRQKSEPVLSNALNVIRHYSKATECMTTVIGPDYNPVDISSKPEGLFFCSVCKEFRRHHCKNKCPSGLPCQDRHHHAVDDSCRGGGTQIYSCDLGFLFWTSPFYSGELFAGAAIGSGVLGIKHEELIEKIQKMTGGEVPLKQIREHLDWYPDRSYEDVKSMAQMMLICADQLSIKTLTPELFFRDEHEELTNVKSAYVSSSDNETHLLAALRRGDREEARKTLGNLLEKHKAGGSLEALQMRAIELATLVSRAAARTDNSGIQDIIEENDKCIRKMEDAHSSEEVFEILDKAVNLMAGKMFSFQGILHSAALRKAERFIWKNYTRKISLKEIAGAAGLSTSYFSTIFREEMGIHLSHYINRLRVAKAASRLVETNKSINCIASACGFEDQSWFSKIFKSHTGVSPGKYRELGGLCSYTPGWMGQKKQGESA